MRLVHCKVEPYDVYIGRPSVWGNPYSHLEKSIARFRTESREAAVEYYERDARVMMTAAPQQFIEKYLMPIAGKVLGCWCAPRLCHGEVLIRLCRENGLIE